MKGKIKTAEMKVSWCVRVYLILPPFSFSLGAFGVCMFAPFLSIITRQFVACSSVVYRRPVPIKRPVPRRAGPPFNRRFLEPTLVCPPNTRRHLRSANRHLLAVPRVSGSTLTAVGRSQLLARWPGTHSRILYTGSSEQCRLF